MKAIAEKSSQRRRPHAVAGGRAAAAPAQFFRRLVVLGATLLLALGATLPALGVGLARADEPPAPTSAGSAPAASTLPPEEIERQAEAIARSIMSPFCPGRTVSACPVAGPWRDDIRRWVAEGVDSIEIKRRLAERVPEHNLGGAPKNRLGWALPVGLGIAAVALLVFLLRRLVGPGAAAASSAAKGGSPEPKPPAAATPAAAAAPAAKTSATPAKPGGDDYDARLQEELETLEQ